MSDLEVFLRARIDEDEATAKDKRYIWPTSFEVTLNPARVLREVQAKRAILAAYAAGAHMDTDDPEPEFAYGHAVGLGEAVRALAAVYSDHPDYDRAWATEGATR